jgi:DNA topoisomerase-1
VARTGGWRRVGSRRRFRYVDSRGRRITDPAKLARIEALRIPPAWREVRISPRPSAKLQATGIDAAGRKQYLYHASFREAREQAKYEKLIGFAERLPSLRALMAEHMEKESLDPDRICAVATRLINLTWFRVGDERYAKQYRTFGITTLRKKHVSVRGRRVTFSYQGKRRLWVRTAVVDDEISEAIRDLLRLRGGGRLFRYRANGEIYNLSSRRLNDYIRANMGDDFTAKDFRTWGGTMVAAIAFAEHGPAESQAQAKRVIAAVMRKVGEQLGNTPAVARSSYVSPAVVEQYLDGRTIEDFRPRHLRVVRAREIELEPEEQAVLSLLRSWRIRRAREAA